MKKPLIAILLLLFCLGCTREKKAFPPEEYVAQLMDESIRQTDLPALVAIAVNKQGEKVSYRYGNAIWTEETAVTPDHIFRIYSMTKLVTSIAALQMVEKGFIGLDDDLSEILPEMSRIPILSNGEFMVPANPITLRHLLTHTSGFGYAGSTVEAGGYDPDTWEYEDTPRHFESSTDFLYGTSTDWAGRLVEKLSGQDLEAYFRQNITGPLGMNRTFFNVPDSLYIYIVSRGTRGEDGEQPLKESPNRIPGSKTTVFSGGGGLFSTPSDYTKLLHCLLNEGAYSGGQLIAHETFSEMIRNQVGAISLDPTGRTYDPGSCCNFNGLMDKNSKWGLAFMIDNKATTYGRQAGTLIWGGYYNTYFFIDVKSGIAASIYTQHIPFNHPYTTSLFDRFAEIVYSGK